ncbi:ParB/RepB/Spo0J family partition protein [Zavarzinella formosa]|uniref:ParB/RepB/Spo0J family partition protein n=1 Tax=Zavarzinella formosa TaxID=360055 RepID=UPI0002F69C03|nr:ParB/RepB/Spo0J family partition protein [Zavarzinella formosa]
MSALPPPANKSAVFTAVILTVLIASVKPSLIERTLDLPNVASIAKSLVRDKQQVPVVVVKIGDGQYRLVDGAHRIAAAIQLGWEKIEVKVIGENLSPFEEMTLTLSLNRNRKGTSPIDQAIMLHQLKEATGSTILQIAEQVGMSPASVQRSLDIHNRIPAEIRALIPAKLAPSKASLIAQIKDVPTQIKLAQMVVDQNLPREVLLAEIQEIKRRKRGETKAKPISVKTKAGSVYTFTTASVDVLVAELNALIAACKKIALDGLPWTVAQPILTKIEGEPAPKK